MRLAVQDSGEPWSSCLPFLARPPSFRPQGVFSDLSGQKHQKFIEDDVREMIFVGRGNDGGPLRGEKGKHGRGISAGYGVPSPALTFALLALPSYWLRLTHSPLSFATQESNPTFARVTLVSITMKFALAVAGIASVPFVITHTIFTQLTADGKTYGRERLEGLLRTRIVTC